MKKQIINVVKTFVVERPAKAAGIEKLRANLERSASEIDTRLDGLSEASGDAQAKRHRVLRHIIAIERWGQSRLKVLLGEPFKQDENHPYKPPGDSSWQDLRADFNNTRAETLRIVDALPEDKLTDTVFHNDLGDMSALGWLRYLSGHAGTEAKRIK